MKTVVRVLVMLGLVSALLAPTMAQGAPGGANNCVWVGEMPSTGQVLASTIATTDGASWDAGATINSWSPDRSKVATVDRGLDPRATLGVRVANPDGTGSKLVTETIPPSRTPLRWSPDGRKLAMKTYPSGSTLGAVLQVVDIATGTLTQISDGTLVTNHYAWSPDSSTLIWTEVRGNTGFSPDSRQADVFSAPADGSGSPTLIIETAYYGAGSYAHGTVFNPPGNIADLSFSPDGTRIVFTGTDFDGAAGTGNFHDDLWVANADGTNIRLISDNNSLGRPLDHSYPTWPPDGTRIAVGVYSQTASQNGLAIVNASSGSFNRILVAGAVTGPAAWSDDGTYVAFNGDRALSNFVDDLRIANVSTGAVQTINTYTEEGARTVTVEWVPCTASMPTCHGKRATIIGTNGPDKIRGTKKRDVIVSFGGNDNIKSLKGNDLICAGAGKDTVRGGAGKDRIYGEAGKDKLYGQGGNDKLYGQGGKDKLYGGPGNDLLHGGPKKDVCKPGSGKDKLRSCP